MLSFAALCYAVLWCLAGLAPLKLRSAAVWSSVGHVVALGDRLGENLLIHTETGECVHVDFDCLFDKVRVCVCLFVWIKLDIEAQSGPIMS